MVFANPSKVTRLQLTTRNSHSSSDLCGTHSRCRPLDISDRPCGTVEVQVSQLLFVYTGFRGILTVLWMCELDSAVLFRCYSADTKTNCSQWSFQNLFMFRYWAFVRADYLRFAALVADFMWITTSGHGRLQLVCVGVKLETSSTGFLSEILQKVSHLGSDLL